MGVGSDLTAVADDSPAAPADPDIPHLTVSRADTHISSLPMHLVQPRASHEYHADDMSDSGNEQDDEDTAEEDNNATDRAEDFKDDSDNDVFDENDVEASFIQRTKPPCSKTRLVSCLSSRSTSPGPISPLLSDDDFPSLSCGSSLSSRRSSSNESSQRVRFKRGCVITQVNLTWAATSYDRHPISVGESLDIKRCHSMDCDETGSPKALSALLADNSMLDEEDLGTPREEAPIRSRDWLALNAPEPQSDAEDCTPVGSQQPIRPPSPPLASSQCTAAHANYAYASTFGEIFGMEGLETSSIPSLSPDESSTGSGSESDECHWSNRPPSSAAGRSLSPSRTIVSHPASLSAATAESSLGLAAMELSEQCRREALAAESSIGRSRSPSAERPTLARQSPHNHELSPPPAEEQPLRKVPRYGMCAMGKFSRDEVFDACDALGGF